MNYIKHLKGFYLRMEDDEKITPHHISLYMALFQFWNNARFRGQFDINRQELMTFPDRFAPYLCPVYEAIKRLGIYRIFSIFQPVFSEKVSCVRFDITSDTTTDITNDTATDTTSSTLFINNTNYNKG